MTTVESLNKAVAPWIHRYLRRASTDAVQFTVELAAIVVVVTYVTMLLTVRLPYSIGSVPLYSWLECLVFLAPVIPILPRLRKDSPLRGPWLLIGLGIVLFDLADVLRLLGHAGVVPFATSSPRDAMLVLSYVSIAVAVAAVVQHSFGPRAISVRLDGLIAGLAITALTSMYWFHQYIDVRGHTLVSQLNIFNPMLVVILLVLLAAGLVPNHFHFSRPAAWLLIGLISIGAGDFVQLNRVAMTSHVLDTLVTSSRPFGMCCLALAAWPRIDRREEPRETLVPPLGLNLIPVIFGVISIAILATAVHRPTSEVTTFMALGSLLIVILRMVMTQGEMRQLGRSHFVDARTDNVTGLSNRRAFLEDGEAKLANLRPDEQLALVLVDLDGFKEVNDSLGHAHGDELLKIVGRRFAKKIGLRGSMSRIGGDEFACTLLFEQQTDPVAFAKELARALSDPVSVDRTKVRVSASIGVAIWPHHGTTHTELLRSADVAMYEAKRSRDAVRVYNDGIDENTKERLTVMNDLRTAIDRHRLTLHFQPTRHVLTGSVHGVEALLRWQHPTLGLLQPDDFIPLAEKAGLISPLTRAVLDLAITELARLHRNGHALQMSVNISQWDLLDPELPSSIWRMLEWHHLPADRLVLEVTESSLSQDPALARASIERLRSLGVKISIDDFGVGYSSISQLLELPVDELKIDKSFILALDTDSRAISLIRSIIEMARALGLTVVAEGVETARSFETMSNIGADVIQGNYVGYPLASVDLDIFLLNEAARDSVVIEDTMNAAVEPDTGNAAV
ncbi:MAG TPA: EAL domain-containing protein [Acidimicrobiales bacterium]|nr:EAL domain-containing protein [Acidimicrobiales bacterium]